MPFGKRQKKAGGVLLSHGRCGSAAWREKGKGVRALLSPPALTPYSIAKSPSPCPALAFRSQLRASQARSASVPPPICFAPLRSPLRSRSTLGLSRSWSTTWLQRLASGKTCLRGGLALGRGRSAANQGLAKRRVKGASAPLFATAAFQRWAFTIAARSAASKAQHAAVRNRRVSTRRSAAPTVPDAPSRRGAGQRMGSMPRGEAEPHSGRYEGCGLLTASRCPVVERGR